MRNIYAKILLLVASVLLFASCDNWLDNVKQTGSVSDDIVWQDAKYVDMNVNACYTFLHKYGQFGDYQFGGSLTESLTDTFKYGSVALGARAGHPNDYVTNPAAISPDGCYYSVWQGDIYSSIRQVNQFLQLQKEYSKFSAEQNKLWEAQVKFFRAFLYFQLAKRHGGVVIYDALPTEKKGRSTADQTWDFIEEDLNFAAANLPEEWPSADKGRVTKGAAYAMLSRAMLYAERWQKAYDAAYEVVLMERYDLVDDYAQSWKGGNKESILEFAYNANSGPNHTFDKWYVSACDGYEFGALGTPTQEMVESYEDKDGNKVDWSTWHSTTDEVPPYADLEPRFAATVLYRGSVWKGRTMDCSVNGTNGAFMPYKEQSYSYGKTTTGYFLRKLLDESLIDIKGQASSQTWVEIRYAEVLLNLVEAAYRLDKINEAQDYLAIVRNRVNLPKKTSTGEEFFNDYRNERKVELAYEGHLFWDMRRWKLAHIEYNDYRCHGLKFELNSETSTMESKYIEVDDKDRKFDTRTYVLPVPTEEIRNNSFIVQYDEWI